MDDPIWDVTVFTRRVHSVSWRAGPLGCGLPRVGSVCLAALPGLTTGNNDLKTADEVR